MSSSAKPKGHGHQFSVADAATLFGSASDDPFTSLVGEPEPGLDGIDEEAEEKAAVEVETAPPPPAAAAVEDGSIATPKAHISTLPEVATESLEPPMSSTEAQGSLASSPSVLFASSATNDFFSGNNGDDWLAQNGEVQHDASTHLKDHQAPQHAFDYQGYANGTESGMGYNNHYQAEGALFDENGYGSQYANGAYQQHIQDDHQAQYSQSEQPPAHYEAQPEHYNTSYQLPEQGYDHSAGQYDQYSEQQREYDPAAYGYGQQGYDESNGGYQQDIQSHAEQYNQYDPSYGQPDPYSQQQPQHEASLGQYDSASHQQDPYEPTSHQYDQVSQPQHAYDPPSEQYDAYNEQQQQQAYDPALYGQGEEGVLESAGFPQYDQVGQGEAHEAAGYPYYAEPTQEERQADDGGESAHLDEHQYATTYPAYDYSAQQEEAVEGYPATHASTLEDSLSPHTAPYAAGPYDPSRGDNYSTNAYTLPAQEDYGASYTPEVFAADETIQQREPQGFVDWSGADSMPQDGYTPGVYSARAEGLGGDDLYNQTGASSGYFDNLAIPPVLQHEDEAQSTRSLDVASPYDPPFASAGLSSVGESAYMAQDRTLDAAEERHRAKIPLASFSVDGKLLTFFPTWSHDASEDAYASGVGGYGLGSSAAPTKVTIRPLRSVIPPTSYATSNNPLDFPGPALEGEPNQGSALSRATGASASTNKAKKTALIKYLNDAAIDMASGISYLAAGKQASEVRRMKDRILILRMLIIVLEHDGNIVNNAAFDSAAKELLLADQDGAPLEDMVSSDLDRSPIPGPSADQKARFLNQMEGLLMAGQRKEAVDLAVREKMWTHAVIIASGMDRGTWREVVGQFVENEFDQAVAGHQGLKVAYHLFSGQEPKTTYDLFRSKTLLSTNSTHSQDDDVSANLSQWRKSVATILANRSNGDSATLTAIGDGLAVSGWIEAAHICYLLSPQTSPMEGYDGPSTRLTLLGAVSPEASTLFVRDLDHIILTEVFEYALSLQPVAKGAEAYHGLAYLQSYRLVHAYLLAEMGEVKRAIRYCDSIMTLLKHGKMNRYYHPVLLHQLQELSNRLQGDTKSTSWTKKKPTMDGVWSALEGRFTKFIAGEEGGSSSTSSRGKGAAEAAIGPFSHYSAITPEARAGGMSRVHSTGDFRNGHPVALTVSRPQSRPGSALSLHPNYPTPPNPRSVSEYGYNGRDSSALSSPKHSIGRDSSDADLYGGPFTTHSYYDQEIVQPVETASYGYEPHGANQFQFISNVDEDLSSAMMNQASINTPSTQAVTSYQPDTGEEDEEDDLGFGNRSSKKKSSANVQSGNDEGGDKQSKEVPAPEKKKEGELKPASSWFALPKLWGRNAAADAGETKAKKAHLGEEVSFYYDTELKRWINKKAGDTGAAASPPPPPPRAQTASPSNMGGNMPSTAPDTGSRRVLSEMRPPPSSSSGSSLNTLGRDTPSIAEATEAGEGDSDYSPTKSSIAGRNRSNLADGPAALQPGPPVRPGGLDGPPRTASTSSAKRKPLNKRYIAIP